MKIEKFAEKNLISYLKESVRKWADGDEMAGKQAAEGKRDGEN